MALDTTMNDMDIDMTFDEEEDPEITRMRAQAAELDARAEAVRAEAMNGVEEVPEEGEIDSNAGAPEKVHIRGLDRLTTDDVEHYAAEHYSMDLFKRVQWVDDTSANLIYDTPNAAAEALAALSAEEVTEPLQLRAAKRLSTFPDAELQVRQAIVSDVKIRGAKDRSRFYLMNPHWDPDNPESQRSGSKRRRADDGYGHNKYRRRDYGDDKRRQRGSRDRQPEFHEDMYGDDPQAASDSRRNSISSSSEYSRSRQNRGETRGETRGENRGENRGGNRDVDLFASRRDGRLRNRSASPARGEDGRYGFEDTQPYRPTARARSRTPPGVRSGRDNRGARDTFRKELFPDKTGSTVLTNGNSTNHSRPTTSASNHDLFPDKLHSPSHRRQDAKHIDPDEVATAIGRRPDPPDRSRSQNAGRDLFARIQGGPESSYGRLSESNGDSSTSGSGGGGGFSIKGAGDAGFSILGASKDRVQSPLVKELFPFKAGVPTGPRELFNGQIKGRAGRRRAEDFY